MTEKRTEGSTNGPTEPNQRPPERRDDPAETAVKGPKIISEGNAKQRSRENRQESER